jgi:hypothetical protein
MSEGLGEGGAGGGGGGKSILQQKNLYGINSEVIEVIRRLNIETAIELRVKRFDILTYKSLC